MITRGIRVLSPSRGPSNAYATSCRALHHILKCSFRYRPRTTSTKNRRRIPVANSLVSGLQEELARVAAVLLAVTLACTSLPCSAAVLGRSPTYSADYAAVVRKREGRSKSNLPSSREAEALLEINEDLFTTEALEGMSRSLVTSLF